MGISMKRVISIGALSVLVATSLPLASGLVGSSSSGAATKQVTAQPTTLLAIDAKVAAGQLVEVDGRGCYSTTAPSRALVSLMSPRGYLVSSTIAHTGLNWYAGLMVPEGTVPSSAYSITATCKTAGATATFAPASITVTTETNLNLTLSPAVVTPGKNLTVSGTSCKYPTDTTGPLSATATLYNDEGWPIDVSAVTPATSGAWSTTLAVPAGIASQTLGVGATCDQYVLNTSYYAHSIRVQAAATPVPATTLIYRGATTAPAGSAVSLTAHVVTSGSSVAGLPIAFKLGSATATGVTNGAGTANVIITAPAKGSTTVSASFAGSTSFGASSSGSVPFTVTAGLTATKIAWTGPSSAREGQPVVASATLTTSTGAPIASRSVTFTYSGAANFSQTEAVSGLTNSSGVATASIQPYTTGALSVSVSYNDAFDTTYASSPAVTATTVTITPPFAPASVACYSTTSCVVVGGSGDVETTTNAAGSWTYLTTPTTQNLTAVACPSSTLCVAVGLTGTIETSANGGATWTSRTSGVSSDLGLISCPTTTDCVAAGADGVILRSTNLGVTWSKNPTGTDSDVGTYTIHALACPDTTLCLATAYYGEFSGLTISSSNGGASWTTVTDSQPGFGLGPHSLSCVSHTDCVSATIDGGYEESTDGGNNWKQGSGSSSTDGGPAAVSCLADGTCNGIAEYGYPGTVQSTNGGSSWGTTTGTVTPYVYANPDIACFGTLCVAVGTTFEFGPQSFTSTTSGASWSSEASL